MMSALPAAAGGGRNNNNAFLAVPQSLLDTDELCVRPTCRLIFKKDCVFL